jgi:glycosyltransferase involved in cell wall biosynthesis
VSNVSVGVAVPTIPTRAEMLLRALASVMAQDRPADAVSIAVDHDHAGAAATRNRAWRGLDTDWVAFIDDDDEWFPEHLTVLLAAAEETGADIIYPWFELSAGNEHDPLYINGERAEGKPFDDESARFLLRMGNFVPVTTLVRRVALEKIDGFPQCRTARWGHAECEDWGCWQDMLRAGFRFHHVPQRTWRWNWHSQNTSGRMDRWTSG